MYLKGLKKCPDYLLSFHRRESLITAGFDGQVYIWDLTSCTLSYKIQFTMQPKAVLSDVYLTPQQVLVLRSSASDLQMYDVASSVNQSKRLSSPEGQSSLVTDTNTATAILCGANGTLFGVDTNQIVSRSLSQTAWHCWCALPSGISPRLSQLQVISLATSGEEGLIAVLHGDIYHPMIMGRCPGRAIGLLRKGEEPQWVSGGSYALDPHHDDVIYILDADGHHINQHRIHELNSMPLAQLQLPQDCTWLLGVCANSSSLRLLALSQQGTMVASLLSSSSESPTTPANSTVPPLSVWRLPRGDCLLQTFWFLSSVYGGEDGTPQWTLVLVTMTAVELFQLKRRGKQEQGARSSEGGNAAGEEAVEEEELVIVGQWMWRDRPQCMNPLSVFQSYLAWSDGKLSCLSVLVPTFANPVELECLRVASLRSSTSRLIGIESSVAIMVDLKGVESEQVYRRPLFEPMLQMNQRKEVKDAETLMDAWEASSFAHVPASVAVPEGSIERILKQMFLIAEGEHSREVAHWHIAGLRQWHALQGKVRRKQASAWLSFLAAPLDETQAALLRVAWQHASKLECSHQASLLEWMGLHSPGGGGDQQEGDGLHGLQEGTISDLHSEVLDETSLAFTDTASVISEGMSSVDAEGFSIPTTDLAEEFRTKSAFGDSTDGWSSDEDEGSGSLGSLAGKLKIRISEEVDRDTPSPGNGSGGGSTSNRRATLLAPPGTRASASSHLAFPSPRRPQSTRVRSLTAVVQAVQEELAQSLESPSLTTTSPATTAVTNPAREQGKEESVTGTLPTAAVSAHPPTLPKGGAAIPGLRAAAGRVTVNALFTGILRDLEGGNFVQGLMKARSCASALARKEGSLPQKCQTVVQYMVLLNIYRMVKQFQTSSDPYRWGKIALLSCYGARLKVHRKHHIGVGMLAVRSCMKAENYVTASRLIEQMLPSIDSRHQRQLETMQASCLKRELRDKTVPRYECPLCETVCSGTLTACPMCDEPILFCYLSLQLVKTASYHFCSLCRGIVAKPTGNACPMCQTGELQSVHRAPA